MSADREPLSPEAAPGRKTARAERRVNDAGVDLQRIVRRETRPSRALAAILAAVLVGMFAAYGLLEAGVHAVGHPSWLIEPHVAARRITALPDGLPPSLLGAGGGVLAMVGLFFLLQAVLPGRRARHALEVGRLGIPADSVAVVVDDEVIASALARRARIAANVTPEQVMVVVSHKQILVNVRPTSGAPVSEDAVLAAVRDELVSMAPLPFPEVRVVIAGAGVIGA